MKTVYCSYDNVDSKLKEIADEYNKYKGDKAFWITDISPYVDKKDKDLTVLKSIPTRKKKPMILKTHPIIAVDSMSRILSLNQNATWLFAISGLKTKPIKAKSERTITMISYLGLNLLEEEPIPILDSITTFFWFFWNFPIK